MNNFHPVHWAATNIDIFTAFRCAFTFESPANGASVTPNCASYICDPCAMAWLFYSRVCISHCHLVKDKMSPRNEMMLLCIYGRYYDWMRAFFPVAVQILKDNGNWNRLWKMNQSHTHTLTRKIWSTDPAYLNASIAFAFFSSRSSFQAQLTFTFYKAWHLIRATFLRAKSNMRFLSANWRFCHSHAT